MLDRLTTGYFFERIEPLEKKPWKLENVMNQCWPTGAVVVIAVLQ